MKTFLLFSVIVYMLLAIVIAANAIYFSVKDNPNSYYFWGLSLFSFICGKIVERMWINFEIGGVI